MIITAMYLYGMIQGSWKFSLDILYYFLADVILIRLLSSSVRISIVNKISDEEKYYWSKKGQFEELRIDELDRKLHEEE